jgi:hypothetical protein
LIITSYSELGDNEGQSSGTRFDENRVGKTNIKKECEGMLKKGIIQAKVYFKLK